MSDDRLDADDLEFKPPDLGRFEGAIIGDEYGYLEIVHFGQEDGLMSDDKTQEMAREMQAVAEKMAAAFAALRDEAQKAALVFDWATEEMAKAAERLAQLEKNGNA
jgi:hypothetical protein